VKKRDEVLAWLETVPEAVKVPPRDKSVYLSTSPWQVLPWDYELEQKVLLVKKAFGREQVAVPAELLNGLTIRTEGQEYGYRNKMEFSFYGDEDGLHLAFYVRKSHGKVICESESLCRPALWQRAQEILVELRQLGVEARDLKTLILRVAQDDRVVAKLFCKNYNVKNTIKLTDVEVVYSDPKSPASVVTEVWQTADTQLTDQILGREYRYNVDSFFQINLPVYELALEEMRRWLVGEKVLDLYAGVGTIGLTIAREKDLTLVEVSEEAYAELKRNYSSGDNPAQARDDVAAKNNCVLAKAEDVLQYIDGAETVIVDPPRAGLHRGLIEKLLEAKPQRVIYLSCKSTTQARDVKWLTDGLPHKDGTVTPGAYRIVHLQPFNFFPKTPHIENLVVLERA
jgi:23S rRNA (uracil1939-C5)-methyltransferase